MVCRLAFGFKPSVEYCFSALGNLNHNPWLINFAIRLLQEEKQVLKLINLKSWKQHFPDSNSKPVFLRMFNYNYHYVDPNDDGIIWRRDKKKQYLATIDLESTNVQDYLKRADLTLKLDNANKTKTAKITEAIRELSDSYPAENIIFTFLILIIFRITKI